MSKRIRKAMVTLMCLVSIGMVGCGNTNNANNQSNKTVSNAKVQTTFKDMTKMYEKEGLNKQKSSDSFSGYDRNLLSDNEDYSKETNRAGVFGKGNKVVRSFVTCSLDKTNEKQMNELIDILFTNMTPDFKEYKTWVDDMISTCKTKPDTEHRWNRNDMRISVEYRKASLTSDTDTINIDITMNKVLSKMFNITDSGKVVELNEDGKTSKSTKDKKENKNVGSIVESENFFNQVFAQLSNKSFNEITSFLDSSDIKYTVDTQESSVFWSITVFNPKKDNKKDGKRDLVTFLYEPGSKDANAVMSSFTYGDKVVNASYLYDVRYLLKDGDTVFTLQEVKQYLFDK